MIILGQNLNANAKRVKSPTLQQKVREKHAKERKDRVRNIDRDEHLAGHQATTENADENGNTYVQKKIW